MCEGANIAPMQSESLDHALGLINQDDSISSPTLAQTMQHACHLLSLTICSNNLDILM